MVTPVTITLGAEALLRVGMMWCVMSTDLDKIDYVKVNEAVVLNDDVVGWLLENSINYRLNVNAVSRCSYVRNMYAHLSRFPNYLERYLLGSIAHPRLKVIFHNKPDAAMFKLWWGV